jgi:hypothetical protein
VPGHVHPLLHDGGMIYLNSQSGRWGETPRQYAAVLLSACGAQNEAELDWPEFHRPEPQTARIMEGFVELGLLASGPGTNPAFPRVTSYDDIELSTASVVAMTRPLAEPRPPETRLEKLAALSIGRALTLAHNEPFPAFIAEIQRLRGPHAVPATVSQTREIATAVRQVSDWLPGKFACLERTAATAIVGAQEGLHIGLQFGASVDPISYHVWPTVAGQAVTLPYESSITGQFWPVMEV